jgi:hypothetical protein
MAMRLPRRTLGLLILIAAVVGCIIENRFIAASYLKLFTISTVQPANERMRVGVNENSTINANRETEPSASNHSQLFGSVNFILDINSTKETGDSVSFDSINNLEEAPRSVVNIEGIELLYEYMTGSWAENNPFCETIRKMRAAEPSVHITFNITFSCQELYDVSGAGTGNYLTYFYGLRRVAWSHENVELIYLCHDAEVTKYDLILPWVTGRVPARPPGVPAVDESEGAHCYYGPSHHDIRKDLRVMALGLLGLPNSMQRDHPLVVFAEQLWSQERESDDISLNRRRFIPQLPIPQRLEDLGRPPYSDLHLDEVAVHFRCGDLMDSMNGAFSFMRFQGYVRHISPNVTTIGILTQPFDDDTQQSRWPDSSTHVQERCRTVVHSLVDYIQERHPTAQIFIRNERTERITLSYLRLIMAQQAVSGVSSFGVMPIVATFGRGYVRLPDQPAQPYRDGLFPLIVNFWVLVPRIDELTGGQVVLFEEPSMPVSEMKALWEREGENGVLAWFQNDTTASVS